MAIDVGVDHERKLGRISISDGDRVITSHMDLDEIGDLMAALSQVQHALVMGLAGECLEVPFDPAIAFRRVAGTHAVGAYERLQRFAAGLDEAQGMVALILLSELGRISGYRMSADLSRKLGAGLIRNADAASHGSAKQ
jgi:hypothetical protein